jgi:5-carboxymethyl-2-hydroxymuconate isomerase
MPHITLEYTDNIDQPIEFHALFAELHQVLADVAGIDIANCKSRARRLDTYHIGEEETGNAFVHLEVQLFEGRSPELKREIGKRGLDVLKKHFARSLGDHNLQITLQVRDIQRQAYFKAISE